MKINKEQAIKLRESGKTLQEIGDKFGVTRQSVYKMLKKLKYCKKCGAPII